ncbi:alpha/beta fold hydrolase [Tabrizicola sp.]|uniref:alpha/beta fold hydrolase n=1 Tax=Tabrizicola sp. TaxID=2005166 RepID=UPI0035B03013
MTLVWLSDLRLEAGLTGPDQGPPLVLVHGAGMDLRLWDALLPHLPRHRILRLSLRGHGRSDAPPPPYALGTLIRDVERLISHFALKETVVVGAGEGGLIAQGLAVKRLDLVRAMVLTGAATRLVPRPGDPEDECARLLGPRWRDQPALAQVRAMLEATRPEGRQGLAAATASADLYQTTASLRLPTLVLAGADDRKVPPDLQRELADLVAGAQFQLLPKGTHLAMLTQPQAFAGALGAFLTRIGHV